MEIGQIAALAKQIAPEHGESGRTAPEAHPSARGQKVLARALAAAALGEESLRQTDLRLQVEDDLGRVVARVVDSETGKVLREVPPEELIELAKTMRALLGQMLDRRA